MIVGCSKYCIGLYPGTGIRNIRIWSAIEFIRLSPTKHTLKAAATYQDPLPHPNHDSTSPAAPHLVPDSLGQSTNQPTNQSTNQSINQINQSSLSSISVLLFLRSFVFRAPMVSYCLLHFRSDSKLPPPHPGQNSMFH